MNPQAVLSWQQTIDAAWLQQQLAAGHFDSDWAGRAILLRYLTGGDDWSIVDDPDWTKYMKDNQPLRTQLTPQTEDIARSALRDHLAGGPPGARFARTFHAEIENGEGVIGYQYLHGTDATKGDFQLDGATRVTARQDGTYEVTIDGAYTWNDTIDPNPRYQTDRWKSFLAELATLGMADPYDLHITWHAQTRVILDRNGTVLATQGYPAD